MAQPVEPINRAINKGFQDCVLGSCCSILFKHIKKQTPSDNRTSLLAFVFTYHLKSVEVFLEGDDDTGQYKDIKFLF